METYATQTEWNQVEAQQAQKMTCTTAVRKDKARELLSRVMPWDPGFF